MSNPQLWLFLAPTEEGREMEFHGLESTDVLLARKNRSEKPPSRPGSAVKDNLSRKVLYGKQAVRSHGPLSEFTDEGQVERGKVRNPTDVPLIGGFPHGFGSKTYDVKHEWGAHVLPFGPIMNKLNHVRGPAVSYSRFLKELCVLDKIRGAVIVCDGRDAVKSVVDAHRVLERCKFTEGRAAALLIAFCSSKFPVLGLLAEDFEFSPLQWPSVQLLEKRAPEVRAFFRDDGTYDGHNVPWHVRHDSEVPPTVEIEAVGTHVLDQYGHFPEGGLRARALWHGREFYVGCFDHGVKHGRGALLRSTGDLVVTDYVGGTAHGPGTYFWRDGNIWIGTWHHGQQAGRGRLWTTAMQEAAVLLQGNMRVRLARGEFRKARAAAEVKQVALELQRARARQRDAKVSTPGTSPEASRPTTALKVETIETPSPAAVGEENTPHEEAMGRKREAQALPRVLSHRGCEIPALVTELAAGTGVANAGVEAKRPAAVQVVSLAAPDSAKTREKEILALHYALLSKATGATP